MAKIISYLRLKNMTMLQSFVALNCVYLVAVLTAIVFEFDWADRIRRRFADHPFGNDWVITAQIIAMLLTIGIGLVLIAGLFYKLKLKKPLEILMSASKKISSNDLGFHVSYDSKDEMSELCRAFEKMRSQLESNFKALWRSVEERNQLNAIFAHDLRTPLSIMKGYSEFITTYLPQKRISEEKLLDTIKTMETHILRMERYVESMNSIQKLDDMPINKQEIEFDTLIALLDNSASRIADQSGKTSDSCRSADSTLLFVDMDLVMQVFENMVANGARYASNQVNVDYLVYNGIFSITVTDDGSGFSNDDLRKSVLPFYRGVEPEANEHQGLGLYICKVLCEKHQGGLQVANSSSGGGKVTANFLCHVDK
ncbi:sensor histidine kinase [Paenibacillus sp. Soil724D2]|uniref:HAMP domain-containing sensor histidine kinase n=1 Tax=Paenibacillus sp. (strain Soil724D2) TaxID=1736392 RepID=UPI0007151F2D|nr:HAMP domain-containing sensor histidine kinase [Paenibacillus sp. Soil724D2]KRE46569.1 histidine kinase [Paenibacillus sp. Soil724D2]